MVVLSCQSPAFQLIVLTVIALEVSKKGVSQRSISIPIPMQRFLESHSQCRHAFLRNWPCSPPYRNAERAVRSRAQFYI